MRQTKVFSVKDGTLQVINNIVVLWDAVNDEIPIATTPSNVITDNVYTLPSTLIRTPKTDEELAEEKYPYYEDVNGINEYSIFNTMQKNCSTSFLAGRKSFGDKKFHLTREQVIALLKESHTYGKLNDRIINNLINSLTSPIYPHTIEVYFEDGVYYWETLKATY